MTYRNQLRLLPIAGALFALATSAAAETPGVVLVPLAGGFDRVTTVTHAGDGSGRLFIVERTGTIQIVLANGTRLINPFLDIADRIDSSDIELGLLALAFDPGYVLNRRFYVAYTGADGDAVVASFRTLLLEPNTADPFSEIEVLRLAQPSPIHNIHQLSFGSEGHLYVGSGDGGPAGDPADNAQDLAVLLGKVLRIDVDGTAGYEIPADNPFVGNPLARDEIWSFGLRNPANFSFDQATADLYLADTGEMSWEELNVQPARSPGGENYGWHRMEGTHCYDPPSNCQAPGLTLPAIEYPHVPDGDCAIIGGQVYRGDQQAALRGFYVFGDFCSGSIRLVRRGCRGWRAEVAATAPTRISALGENEAGEIYVAGWSTVGDAVLYHVETPGGGIFSDGFEDGSAASWDQCVGMAR